MRKIKQNKQAVSDWKLYATSRGFTEDDLGAEFKDFDGRTYKILGWLPRRRKYPVHVEEVSTGKKFHLPSFPANRVLNGLGRDGG
jgi:hypothetical protein